MVNNRVLIRADGNNKIGLGHLTRCVSLIHFIREGYNIIFFSREMPDDYILQLKKLNVVVFFISNESEFIEKCNSNDIVIIDKYEIDIKVFATIKKRGAKVVCIDDIPGRLIDADLIVNYGLGILPEMYKNLSTAKLAIGIDYCLIRPEFIQASTYSRLNNNNELVVCFGGSDLNNLTYKAASTLLKSTFFKKIHLVVGQSYSNTSKLESLVSSEKKFVLYQGLSGQEMADLMCSVEYGLVTASSVAYEAIACGLKLIICYVACNQELFHDYLKNNFEVASLNNGNDIDMSILLKETFLRKISNKETDKLKKTFSTIPNNFRKLFLELITNSLHSCTNEQ